VPKLTTLKSGVYHLLQIRHIYIEVGKPSPYESDAVLFEALLYIIKHIILSRLEKVRFFPHLPNPFSLFPHLIRTKYTMSTPIELHIHKKESDPACVTNVLLHGTKMELRGACS